MTIQDDTGSHRTLADTPSSSDQQELPRGSNLGRYVIIEPVGSGGMGTVYRAYDPQLNRGVALKILSVKHTDMQIAERAKSRLIREAQALARLSHPNVVAVHDAGMFEDDVFIAMELVEGQTLDGWLRQEKRTVKEVVAIMTAAGRGLSAAHRAGLVHRDFKPGNVIVGKDGRVRVLDFGLARAADQAEENGENADLAEPVQAQVPQEPTTPFGQQEISSDSSPNLLQSPLTHVGGVLGTPLYMAPEQHLGLKTDARTDQFGFCVVLYEALYGRRPFAGESLEEIEREVIRHQVRIPKTDTDVPTWLWEIIHTGLSAKPKDRYSSIDLLLEDLDKDPEEARHQMRLARRKKLFVVSLILLTIALPSGLWYGLRYRTFQLCKDAQDEFAGVWDGATRAGIQKSFLDTGKSFAIGTWERVERNIDRHLSEWMRMRTDICEAKLLRATLSEELFDLQMSCLRKSKLELKALVKVFAQADKQIVQKATQASSSLMGVDLCADEKTLRAPYAPPKNKQIRDQVAIVRQKLAEVEVFEKTGKYMEGLILAEKLQKHVNAVDYKPVQAEVLYWLGNHLERAGRYAEAEKTLYQAAQLAGESRNTLLAAKSLSLLVWVIGKDLAKPKEAIVLGRSVEVMLAGFGGNDEVASQLYNNLGNVFSSADDYQESMEHFQKALAINQRSFGPKHYNTALVLNNIGMLYHDNGDYDNAMNYFDRSSRILREVVGDQHPMVALLFSNIGMAYAGQGVDQTALDYYQKALEIRKKALGPEHPQVAFTLRNVAAALHRQSNHAKALLSYRKVLSIQEDTLGPSHPEVAWSLCAIGEVLIELGNPKQALEPLARAVSICKKMTCKPRRQGKGLFSLARATRLTKGKMNLATTLAKQAQDVFEKAPEAFKNELEEVTAWLQENQVRRLVVKKPN